MLLRYSITKLSEITLRNVVALQLTFGDVLDVLGVFLVTFLGVTSSRMVLRYSIIKLSEITLRNRHRCFLYGNAKFDHSEKSANVVNKKFSNVCNN